VHLKLMAKSLVEIAPPETEKTPSPLRHYRAPWKGQLVLACAKCQKRLRRHEGNSKLQKFRKVLQAAAEPARVRVLDVPCLKLCPKRGVAVCTQEQIGRGECSIVWTEEDVEQLARECQRAAKATSDRDGA